LQKILTKGSFAQGLLIEFHTNQTFIFCKYKCHLSKIKKCVLCRFCYVILGIQSSYARSHTVVQIIGYCPGFLLRIYQCCGSGFEANKIYIFLPFFADYTLYSIYSKNTLQKLTKQADELLLL
jgi:hypothetical protein